MTDVLLFNLKWAGKDLVCCSRTLQQGGFLGFLFSHKDVENIGIVATLLLCWNFNVDTKL